MPSLSAESIAMRKTGLGASDTPAILPGVNYYVTPFEVWHSKTSDKPPPEPEVGTAKWFLMRSGSVYEEPIRRMFEALTGKRARAVRQTRRHQECKHVLATLDGTIVGEKAVLEVKNRGMWRISEYGPSGTDQVLDSDLIQTHQQMAVTGAEAAYMAVLLGGQDLRWYLIPRDEGLVEVILSSVESFWADYVATKRHPEFDWSDHRARDYLRLLHPAYDDNTVELGKEGQVLDSRIKAANEIIKAATKDKTEARNRLLGMVGDARIGKLPNGTYWQRSQVRVAGYTVAPRTQDRFDWKKRKGDVL